ncbi:hypothetical protein [Streptomyces chattanoogensis]|uniref:hypothetical protein n=1 Tax=Streptomyces chattanoogensis TaxID=66876 RepID=UPI0005D86F69|nr:hypothetical protein T261_7415 [Streptomyces lydicus]
MAMEYGQQWSFAAECGGLGAAVRDAMRAVGAVSDTAEYAAEGYQRALDTLHGYPDEAVTAVLRRGWETLPECAYPDRWGVVQVLTDLRLSTATDVFEAVLTTPIPPERTVEFAHPYSTVGEEITIRTTAVEGLTRLAAEDDPGAVELLIRHVTDADRSIQVACVMALRDLGEDAGVDVSPLVPEEDQDLLRFRR